MVSRVEYCIFLRPTHFSGTGSRMQVTCSTSWKLSVENSYVTIITSEWRFVKSVEGYNIRDWGESWWSRDSHSMWILFQRELTTSCLGRDKWSKLQRISKRRNGGAGLMLTKESEKVFTDSSTEPKIAHVYCITSLWFLKFSSLPGSMPSTIASANMKEDIICFDLEEHFVRDT